MIDLDHTATSPLRFEAKAAVARATSFGWNSAPEDSDAPIALLGKLLARTSARKAA
jgi:hypothetical protein